MNIFRVVCAVALCSALSAEAAGSVMAVRRTNAENYKDRVLAACLSLAYRGSPAGKDADVTNSAFLEWTYYDGEKGDRAVERLAEHYFCAAITAIPWKVTPGQNLLC